MKSLKKLRTRNRIEGIEEDYRFETCPTELNRIPPSKKQEFLLSHKSSLENMLKLIKNKLFLLITNKYNKRNNSIKEILTELNKNLSLMLKEQTKKINIYKKILTEKKKSLMNKLFNENKNEQKTKKSKSNNQNINELVTEIGLLKLLNFKAKNDIKLINNVYLNKSNEYNYLKLYMPNTILEEIEIFCEQQKYYPIITKILRKKLNNTHEAFKKIVSAKKNQNKEINNLFQNLEELKTLMSRKKYGFYSNIKEIIKEDQRIYKKYFEYK